MARTAEVTIEILKQIPDAVTGTNVRIDETNARLEQMDVRLTARLDETNAAVAALARRQTETEVRLSTEIVEVARAVNGVRDLLRERLDDRGRVDDHERRIGELERKSA
jgi:hypothetical protein